MGEQSSGGARRRGGGSLNEQTVPSDQGQTGSIGGGGGINGGGQVRNNITNGGQLLNNKSNKLLGLVNNGQTPSSINRLHYLANSQSSLMIETETDDPRSFDPRFGAKERQYMDDDDGQNNTSALGQVEENITGQNPSSSSPGDREDMTTSSNQADKSNRPTGRQSATPSGGGSSNMAPELRSDGGGSSNMAPELRSGGGGSVLPGTSHDGSNNSGTSPQDASNNSGERNNSNLPQVCFVQNPNGGFSPLPQPGNENNALPMSGMAPDMDALEMCMRQQSRRRNSNGSNNNNDRGFNTEQGPFLMQNPSNGFQGPFMMQNPNGGQGPPILQGTYNGQGPFMMQSPSTGQGSMMQGPLFTGGQGPLFTGGQGPFLMQGSYPGQGPSSMQGTYNGQGPSMTQGRNPSPGPGQEFGYFGQMRPDGKIQGGGQGFGPFTQRRSEGKIQGLGPFVSLGPEGKMQGGGGLVFDPFIGQIGPEGIVQDGGMFDPRLPPGQQGQQRGGGLMQLSQWSPAPPVGMMTPGNNDRMMIQQQQPQSPGILNSASRVLRSPATTTGPLGNMMGPGVDIDPSTMMMMMDPQMSNGPNNFPGFDPSIQNGFETIDCYIPQPIVDCYLIPQQSVPQGRCRGSTPMCLDSMCIPQNPNRGCPPQPPSSQIIPLSIADEMMMMQQQQQQQPQRCSRCQNNNNDQRITLIREVYHFKKTPRPCPSKKQVVDCCPPTASITSCGSICRPPWSNSYNYKPQNVCRRKIAPKCCPQMQQCPEILEPRCSLLNNCPLKLPRPSQDGGCQKRMGCYFEKPKGCRTPTTLVREYVLTNRNASSVKRNKVNNNGENNEGGCQVAAVITTVPPNCFFKGNNNQAEIQALLNNGNNYCNNEGTPRNSGSQNGRPSLPSSQKSAEPEDDDEGSEGSNQTSLKKKMSTASYKKNSTSSSHSSGHQSRNGSDDVEPPTRKKSSTRKNSTGSSL